MRTSAAPGRWRISSAMRSARAGLSSSLGRRSAGRWARRGPKLRICVTMSPAAHRRWTPDIGVQHTAQSINIGRGGVVIPRLTALDVGVGGPMARRSSRRDSGRSREGRCYDDGDDLFGWKLLGWSSRCVAERGGLFNARAGAGADVNLEWPESTEERNPGQKGHQHAHRADGKEEKEVRNTAEWFTAESEHPKWRGENYRNRLQNLAGKRIKGLRLHRSAPPRLVVLLEQILAMWAPASAERK